MAGCAAGGSAEASLTAYLRAFAGIPPLPMRAQLQRRAKGEGGREKVEGPPAKQTYTALHMRTLLLGCALAGAAIALPASLSPDARLLVVNQGDATMSIVDPATGRVVHTVQEGQPPKMHAHEVAVSADGRTAWLPVYGDSGVGLPGRDGDVLLAVDVATGKVRGRMQFAHGVRPHCAVLVAGQNLLLVTTEVDNAVTAVDTATLKVAFTVPTGAPQSHMLAVAPDGKRAYTANVEPGSVSILDLQSRRLVKVVPVAPKVQRIAISTDGRRVFTFDQNEPRMAVVDTRDGAVERWVPLPGTGYGAAATADGKYLVVPLPRLAELAVVNLESYAVGRRIAVLPEPQEVVLTPDARTAYVASPVSGKVSVVDLQSGRMTGNVAVGQFPDGLAWVAAR